MQLQVLMDYLQILLKNCKDVLAFPIYILWRDSLDTGNIPELLKLANIVPIHKGGSKAFAKSYRPISLTSHLIKIFEKVIRKHIVKYLETNNLLNQGQHGFRSGRSCLTQLIDHYDRVLHQCETGANVDVIYLDFAKAFDKVDHNVLLSKIRNMGIGDKVGIWLYAFLKNRHQVIVTNKSMSEKSNVISGVPQGTVLGPVLFLIMISDVDTDITTSVVSSFADDTRVSKKICSPDDTEVLQQDLNKIYAWTERNNMQFNDDEFELMRYGTDTEINQSIAWYACEASLGKERCVRLNEWKIRRSIC